MSNISITFRGLGDLVGMLEDFGNTPETAKFRQAVVDAAVVGEVGVKAALQRLVYDTPESPFYQRTGDLRNLTQATGKVEREGRHVISSAVESNVDYAAKVHFGVENADGSTRMEARPFMSEGMTEQADLMIEILRKAI